MHPHGRLRLVSSLRRATSPISLSNGIANVSRTRITSRACSILSRGTAFPHTRWNNSRLYPGFAVHCAFQAGCRSSSTIKQAPVTPEMPDHLDEAEKKIWGKLADGLSPVALEVQDVSGGCGSMYAVAITSEKFKGLPVIKQHRLVNEILGEDIKNWHGIQLRTKST